MLLLNHVLFWYVDCAFPPGLFIFVFIYLFKINYFYPAENGWWTDPTFVYFHLPLLEDWELPLGMRVKAGKSLCQVNAGVIDVELGTSATITHKCVIASINRWKWPCLTSQAKPSKRAVREKFLERLRKMGGGDWKYHSSCLIMEQQLALYWMMRTWKGPWDSLEINSGENDITFHVNALGKMQLEIT